ncbi:hypothetical protein [Campylobacter gastrosuis]|uniref:Fe/B12 periplasmic-binding domain-containing protein n=1 Tax=Campylobacter gastrosuis TaxID=2974576 RepID=A0ABT7HRW5_9BACT|nr:hypothetical protein [Campylobacter gastrosuis]MDL0089595.1 hypothetical protein [Campylobacter gastrosuis]
MHKCGILSEYGRVGVSFEQVLAYNPDVILVYQRQFFDEIFNDKKW